jgi:hypothetical protein
MTYFLKLEGGHLTEHLILEENFHSFSPTLHSRDILRRMLLNLLAIAFSIFVANQN